jgi:zinc/manganese transport system substrate-binding protein
MRIILIIGDMILLMNISKANRLFISPRVKQSLAITSISALLVIAGCGSTESSETQSIDESKANIVVTYSVLGSVVEQLVGDLATVRVIISDGQDPHEFEPSAKDIESLNNADLVVSNGLDFEEGLEETIDQAIDSGVNVFMVGDHITVREVSKDEDHGHDEDHAEEESTETTVESEEEHAHGAYDPHLWLSPAAMLEMLPALADAISTATGADLTSQLASLQSELTALDTQIKETIDGITCELVSGHDELGYFADRYGCEVIGAIIPSLSTTSEASAGELAALKVEVEEHGVPAIFTGLGTSQSVADQLASELGVKAVTLSTHFLDGAVNYREFMLRMTNQIAEALS